MTYTIDIVGAHVYLCIPIIAPCLFCCQVIVGAHAVLSDGSFVADAGVYPLAVTARAHGVPIIVVANVLQVRVCLDVYLPPLVNANVRRVCTCVCVCG